MNPRVIRDIQRREMATSSPRVPQPEHVPTEWFEMGCGERTASAFMQGAVAGCFVGAMQAAWRNSPKYAHFPISHTIGGIGQWGLKVGSLCSVFAMTSCAVEELRQKQDPFNSFVGGLFTGAGVGLFRGCKRVGAGAALACGFGTAVVDLFGGINAYKSNNYKKWTSMGSDTPYVVPSAYVEPKTWPIKGD